jgi:nucleoside-diphosphate-sugar epimerase
MKAFVTGASGLLGSNLIRALRWEGHPVTALVPASEPAWPDAGVRTIHGSPKRPAAWLSYLDEADVLFHAAPPTPGVSVLQPQGDEGRWAVSCFTPGVLLGPGDISGSAVGRWILEFLRTGNVGPAFGGTCVVDARDVALAMMASAEIRGEGEFMASGHYVEFAELVTMLEDLTGRNAAPHGRITVSPGWPAASTRAITELGVTFRPIDETLRDIVACYLPRRARVMVA